MDKIKQLIQTDWFVPVLSILIFSIIFWFAGPYIGFADSYPFLSVGNRLIVIICILLIYFTVQLIKHHKAKKLQQQMFKELTDDSGVSDVVKAEASELKNKFEQAFSMLSKTKGGPSSLTELPWYMMIGSPGSGKTTLLSNSGLEFPLASEFSNQAIQGVGGTKNCDWWITSEAVLLDTAGRYVTQDSHKKADESGWNNFLGLIKKYRKKPISGLLISFSMSDLLMMSEYDIQQQLIQIKQRIAEVNDFFGTRFPVYIIVTKTDMLAGFSQFYESFSHKEREQTFGITFSQEESESGSVVGRFSNEFKSLINSLTRRQWQRISQERDASRKTLIYGFSDQFSSLSGTLEKIVASLAKEEKGVSLGILRGVYFTSGTQHGAPIDRMLSKVSQSFGLKNTQQVLWNKDQRSYFIKDLLQQVIFPESDQFGVLVSYEKRKNLIQKICVGIAGVVSLAVCVGWGVSYSNNANFINSSEASVVNWNKQYKDSSGSGDIRNYIPALNDFSANLSQLATQEESHFSGMGLGQADSLQDAFSASYNRLIKTVLLPFVKEQIEAQINQSSTTYDKYQALKAYLMLADETNRDAAFLSNWLKENLEKSKLFSSSEYIQLSEHTEHLIAANLTVDNLNDDLVTKTRQELRSVSLVDIYYEQFKQPYISQPDQMLSLAQLAGNDWRVLFSTSSDDIQTISKLFTPESFKRVTSTELSDYLVQVQKETWLLGEGTAINSDLILKQLEKAYAEDYATSWQQLLTSIKVKSNTNVQGLDSALIALSSADSPLLNLLDSASTSTMLLDDKFSKLAEEASKRSGKINQANKLANMSGGGETSDVFITSQFSKLHELMSKDKKGLTQQRLTAIVSDISMALLQSGDEPVTNESPELKSLQAFAFIQPHPLNTWLNQLGSNVKEVQHRKKKIAMEKLWSEDVLPQCNDLTAYKYPFSKNGVKNISTRDLSRLFADNGILNTFFDDHLKALIHHQAYPWRWKEGVVKSYGFSDEVLEFFEQVSKVRGNLFSQNSLNPQFNYSLKPVYLDSRLKKFSMNIDGTKLNYQFGRPITTRLSWPSANQNSSSNLTFIRRDGSEVIERQTGLYSFFRLVDQGKVNVINANKVEVTFSKEGYKAIYELAGEDGVNPMTLFQLKNFSCLAEI